MTDGSDGSFEAGLRRRAAELGQCLPQGAGRGGRGIVVCGGGERIFTNAYVLLHVLRRTLGCQLPIELWHFDGEISGSMMAAVEGLGVRPIDARPLIDRHALGISDGWQLKALALAGTGFDEIIQLDADQVPVRDPECVFEWRHYREAGAVFWPGLPQTGQGNGAPALPGPTGLSRTSFDSGQMAVDLRRHRGAALLALALNEQAERLHRLVYADKGTFQMAWTMAGAAHAMVPHAPFFDGRCVVQRDFAGAPLFQHRSNGQWTYAGDQVEIEGFVHHADCLAALETLRRQWNGRVFFPPARSPQARAAERQLQSIGHFLFESEEGTDHLELLPHGEIGEGRSYDRANWIVADSGPDLLLAIGDGERAIFELRDAGDGLWTGRRLRMPQVEMCLRPRAAEGFELQSCTHAGLVDQFLRAGGFWTSDGPELEAALTLLARTETGISDRLRDLAALAEGKQHARRLLELAASADMSAMQQDPSPRNDPNILARNYTRPGTKP